MQKANIVLVATLACVQLFVSSVALPQTSSKPAHPPVTLYGRIEQLSTQSGAQLPLTRQSGKIVPDTNLHGQAAVVTPLSATATKSPGQFPDAFIGSWQGELTIHSNQFSPLAFEVDRDETVKEQELLAPAKVGSVTFTFKRSGGQLNLEPSQIIFSVPMSQSRYGNELAELGQSNPMLGQQVAGLLQNSPYYYGLEMGNVEQGVGITGNTLHNKVVKNDIQQLGTGIVEQDLVCYNQETNSQNRRTQNGYSEIVLRFYQQSAQQLYAQVASVNYLSDGRFKDKILLYGNLHRVSSAPPRMSPAQQLPSMPPEWQEMIQQMSNPNLHP